MSASCANPLFLEWLQEFMDQARQHSNKKASVYRKAYDSLKHYPIALNHPSEAQQLNGFGPKICQRLLEKLTAHCNENGLPMPEESKGRKRGALNAGLDDANGSEQPAPPAKRTRKPKAYVPAHRSGAFALIMALSSGPVDALQTYTKTELQELAQPHCDSSFTAPSDPTKFYTAWNSMNTLVEKYLVHEQGRPTRRYALTDEGWELATRIRKVKKDSQTDSRQEKSRQSVEGHCSSAENRPTSRLVAANAAHLGRAERPASSMPASTPSAAVRAHWAQRDQGGVSTSDNRHYDAHCPALQPPDPTCPSTTRTTDPIDLSSSPEPDAPHAREPRAPDRIAMPALERVSTGTPLPEPSLTEAASMTLPEFDPIVLPPGSFSVRVVVDNREVRARDDRNYICDELTKKGLDPIPRCLELGDFFWVAKVHDSDLCTRQGIYVDEVALDWIVERKRLDDLVGSITDGRFQEQKFRLRKSGIKNVTYVIEQYSLSEDKQTRFHEAMRTAIASTQVVNGYFVKQTLKLDDTIRYIARMTSMLKHLYENKPLHIIPGQVLRPQIYLPLLEHLRRTDITRTFHVPYSSFAQQVSKSNTLTVRDVYLKMLMCTRGISGEKALVLQKIWRTPREFVEAYDACADGKEKDRLVQNKLGHHVGRNKIQGVLSAKLANIWGVRGAS